MDCDEETIDHEGTGKEELKQENDQKEKDKEEVDQKEKDKEEVDQEEKGMNEEDDQEKKSKDEKENDQKEKDKEEVDQEEKGMEEEENDQKEKDKEEVDQEEKGMEEEENVLEEKGMKEEDDQEKKSQDEKEDDQKEKGMKEKENTLEEKGMKEEDDQEKKSQDEKEDDQKEKGIEEEENFLEGKDMKGELDLDERGLEEEENDQKEKGKEEVDQEEKGMEEEENVLEKKGLGKKGDQKEKSKDEKENAQEEDGKEEIMCKKKSIKLGNKSKANEVPDEPPKTKKAALERLRNMHFAAKDPFKDKPLRDTAKYSLLSRTFRDRTPPPTLQRKNAEDERRRDRTRDESATKTLSSASGRRRRSRSRPSRYRTDETNASASLIESRHMRGTMFFLQAEQKAAASSLSVQRSRIAQAGAKPLRERIDALLARPDHEVLTMNATEIRALILSGVELFRDQEHFLSGRKAQLIELDTMISQEKEAIEKISKELPNQFRPPPVDEILVQQQQRAAPLQQQQDQHTHQQFNGPLAAHNKQHHFVPPPFLSHQQKQLDFTVPPPSLNMQQPNEFSTPTLPPFANQFLRPPPSLPKPLPQSSAKMTHFGHSPSLLFTKPPPTSISSDDFSKCIPTVPIHNPIVSSNANFAKADSQGGPTPNQQQLSAAKHAAPISLASIPHMSRPPSFGTGHHLPPTGIANNRPEQQQQHQSLLSQSKTPTSIPQLMVSNALKGIHSVSSTSATQSHSTPSFMAHNVQQQHVGQQQQQQQQQNFQQPPPLSYTHSHQQQKQPPQASQSMLSMKTGNVVVVVPQQSQQHHYQQRTLTPLKHTSASSTSIASSSPNQQGASTPSQQAPRPLMSLSIGPPQPQQTKQHSRQSSSSIGHVSGTLGGRQQQQLQFANDGSADGSAARGGKSMRGRLKMVRGAGTRKQHTGKSSDRRPVGGMGLATKEQHHAPRRRRYSSPSPSPWPAAANASRPLESSSSGSVKRLKIEEDFEESSEAQEAEQFSSSSVTRPLSSFTTEPPVTVQAADTTTGSTTDNALVVDEYAALPVSP